MTEPADQSLLPELLDAAGIALDPRQVDLLIAYRDALYTYNQRTNLTAVRDIPGIERRLILESLRLVAPIMALPPIDEATPRPELLDLGTGGGVPGMILAIACPTIHVTLMDATGKKVEFLRNTARVLDLANVTPVQGRAEELAHQPRYRNHFDIVTARAVATLPVLMELGLPFLRTGGHLVLPKGTEIADELVAAERAAAILAASVLSSPNLPDAGSTIDTRLVVIRKDATTPRTYPRRIGVPAKTPLGTGPSSRS